MSTKATSNEDTSGEKSEESDTEKRARWEGFEYRVPCARTVRVENVSYGTESDEHVHVVNVADHGCATGCSCSAWEYQEGPCKHMLAVDDRPAVLLAAATDDSEVDEPEIDIETDVTVGETETTEPQAVADGGQPETDVPETDAPQTDHWDNAVEQYPAEPVGAGERCECQACGERHEIALIGATADPSASNWEEFYACLRCRAKGSFRVTATPTRTWTGQMAYPS